MKKVVALLLVAVMAIGFVSCGKKAGGEIPTLVWYLPDEKQADTALVNDAINKIIEPKIGARIDIQYIPSSNFTERLRLIMAAQEEFDLCFTGFSNPYLNGVRAGGFYDMTDLVEKYGAQLSKSIPDYLWDAVKVDGRIYAVPCYQAMTQRAAIYFNKDLVEKYNFDTSTVTKLEDIEPFLKAVKAGESGNFFPMQRFAIKYFYEDIFRYENTSIDYVFYNNKTGELVFQTDIPEEDAASKKLADWSNKGYFNPDVAASTPISRCACWVTTGYRPGDPEDRAKQAGFEIIPVPISDYAMSRGTATTTMTAISNTSKNPEKAMQFIVEINTNPDVFNLATYGIEGKHYEKLDETHIRPNLESGYATGGRGSNWKYGNMFIGYLMEGYQDDLWEVLKENNDNAIKEKYIDFVADTAPIQTYISNVSTVLGEYNDLSNGTAQNYAARKAERDAKIKSAGKDEIMKFAKNAIAKHEAKKNK